MLKVLNNMNETAQNVEVRCIYGSGHDVLNLIIQFLIETIKLIFGDVW